MGTNERKRRVNRNQVIGTILFVCFLPLGFLLYQYWAEQSVLLKAHFVRADGTATSRFLLEVADTDAKRATGLMYRKELPANRGMAFVYPTEENHSFWMKNTFIPLDIVFVDSNFKVVGILENLPILNEESRRISRPSKVAIEFPGGTAKREGISEGVSFSTIGRVLPVGR